MFSYSPKNNGRTKIREKINRIKLLRKQPNMVENESMEDALIDTAGYAVLTLVELKKKSNDIRI